MKVEEIAHLIPSADSDMSDLKQSLASHLS